MKRTRSFTQALFTGALSLFLLASCELGAPTKGGGTEGEGIVGALVDPSGAPMSNVWVKAYPLSGPGDAAVLGKAVTRSVAVVESVLTNAQGHYVFSNLTVGSYNLTASVTVSGTVYAVLIQGVAVSSSLTNLDNDTVKVTGSFTLQVQSGGQPVVGASCGITATPWVAVSDNAGTCTLTGLPPGTLQVIVSHPTFVSSISQSLAILSGQQTEGGVVSEGEVEAPQAPLLVSPGDVVVVPSSGTLVWTSSVNALTYHIQLGTDSNFTTLTFNDSNGTDTARGYGPLGGNGYFWRVRAKGPGGTSPWSARGVFIVSNGGIDTTPPVDSFPPVPGPRPQLIAPSAFDSITTSSMNFRWTAISGATNYQIQVALDSNFTSSSPIIEDSTITDTMHAMVTPSVGGLFFWRVRAINATTTETSPWAAWSTFKTATPPGSPDSTPVTPPPPPAIAAPTLGTPAQAATVTTTPLLEWGPVSDAVNYRVEVALDSLFTSPVISDSVAVSTAATPPKKVVGPLAGGTGHFWRVRAEKVGAVSAWSSIRFFWTED